MLPTAVIHFSFLSLVAETSVWHVQSLQTQKIETAISSYRVVILYCQMCAQTQPCHKVTLIPTRCDCREVLPNRDFVSVPLIKPSVAGHSFLQFASVSFSRETPDAHSRDTTLCISKKQISAQGMVQTTRQHCHPELFLQICRPERWSCWADSKKFISIRQQDLCASWLWQQLL